jgi:acyl-CoA reductase-like NAD-dependent aldehyde dehydrogenase
MVAPPFATEVAACRAAQVLWSRLAPRERLKTVRKLRHLLVDRSDDLFEAVGADIGRPPVEILGAELLPTTAALRFLERDAARLLKPKTISSRLRPTWLLGCRDQVCRRPWGVVGIIGTWNYPIFLNTVQIAQALVAGNGVVWKPSERAVRTADLLHHLFLQAGFAPALFAKLPATREAGPEVAEADLDHVVFTGSNGVGRLLAARLGERLIPSTLELSGCDAMFVLADADVELAARAAWFGVVLNRGQTCIAVRRIFVPRSRLAAFTEVLKKCASGAEPLPLVTCGQVEQAERLIQDAISRGGEPISVPHGPAAVSGLDFPPTLITLPSTDADICREASFAPIAAIIPFDTLEEAITMASRSPFGLAASIYTADTLQARDIAARLPVGMVTINDVLAPTAHPATPFGGRGASGWGVTQGAEGLLAMTVPQTITLRKGRFRPHVDEEISPDPATVPILRGLLRATHARGVREWLGGVGQLIGGLRNRNRSKLDPPDSA